MMWALGLLALCVWLKGRLDPHDDAFRRRERRGWHFWKAPVVPIRKKK